MTASIPRQSSLQRALSELDHKRTPSSDEENSPRSSTQTRPKIKSSLQKELRKLQAESFLEQYDRYAAIRGKGRL